MSLAFALMAAINGSTGSSATLSHGLTGTKPHRRQSDGSKIFRDSCSSGGDSGVLGRNLMSAGLCSAIIAR